MSIILLAKTQVTIGDVSKDVKEPKHPEYVPLKYCKLALFGFKLCLLRAK